MKFAFEARTASIIGAAALAALVVAAAPAAADPAPPPLPVPAPLPGPALPGPAPLAEPAPLAVPMPLAAEIPVQPEAAAQALAAGPVDPAAEGVPHLVSPENLPPGTSITPAQTQTRLNYVRDLWHAMQTQEVSGSDALLLLTQRPLSASPSTGLARDRRRPCLSPLCLTQRLACRRSA